MKNNIYILILAVLVFAGCDKGFEELNVTPDKPVIADVRAVYNGISSNFRNIGTEQTFFRNELLLPGTQLTGQSRKLGVDAIQRTNLWNGYYTSLANVKWLESELSKEENFNTVNAMAMLKIAKAFTTLKTTDLYGDMPYTEAGNGFFSGSDQIIRPKYDDSKSLYLTSLEDLKWAYDNIVEAPDDTFLSFASTDSYYKGDMLKWKKLANTLRLRYALRISEKEPALAGDIIAEILNGNLPIIEGIDSTSEDFVYNKIEANDTDDLRGPFRAAGSSGVRMGETIWNFMSDSDADDGSGIFDPRLYAYFQPNFEGKWIAVSQDFDSGITPSDDNDVYEAIGPASGHYSPINKNFVFSQTTRTPIVTSSEAYFLVAEAYARGIGVSQDMTKAEENYYNGIKASVNYWYDVLANDMAAEWVYPITLDIPPTSTQMDNFLNHPQVMFTGTDEEKLDKIYGQRWASLFWLPEEAHFLQSRTARTPLTGDRGNFYRLPYPESEEANNNDNYQSAISKMGGNSFEIKLWWMK